jgi:hypothetical protein
MPPFLPLRPLRRGAQLVPVFPDRAPRRRRIDPIFPGIPPRQWVWPAPIFPVIPPRRWAQLFLVDPPPGWDLFPVFPVGPSPRWERLLPVVRGRPSGRRERATVAPGEPSSREPRLLPAFSHGLPRRGV